MSNQPLFTPYRMGDLDLPNRIVMAPLTRMRAQSHDHVPTTLQAEYYAQRASAGLIIAEATAISPEGFGWADTPGLWTEEQVRGWRRVTDAVHAAGGRDLLSAFSRGIKFRISVLTDCCEGTNIPWMFLAILQDSTTPPTTESPTVSWWLISAEYFATTAKSER